MVENTSNQNNYLGHLKITWNPKLSLQNKGDWLQPDLFVCTLSRAALSYRSQVDGRTRDRVVHKAYHIDWILTD